MRALQTRKYYLISSPSQWSFYPLGITYLLIVSRMELPFPLCHFLSYLSKILQVSNLRLCLPFSTFPGLLHIKYAPPKAKAMTFKCHMASNSIKTPGYYVESKILQGFRPECTHGDITFGIPLEPFGRIFRFKSGIQKLGLVNFYRYHNSAHIFVRGSSFL